MSTATVARFPARHSQAIWIAPNADAWLVLARGHGWVHDDYHSATVDARWLADNLQLPVRLTAEKKAMSNKQPQRDFSGILFKNDDKSKETDRDYRGEATIAGISYWMSGWIKQGAKGKFMTFSFKPKNETTAKPKPSLADDLNDQIPF